MIQVVKALPAATYGAPTETSYDGEIWGFVAISPTEIDSMWSHDNGIYQPLIAGTVYRSGTTPWRSLQILNDTPGGPANSATPFNGGPGGGGTLGPVLLAIAYNEEDVADLPAPALGFNLRPQSPRGSVLSFTLTPAQIAAAQSVFYGLDPGFVRAGAFITLVNTGTAGNVEFVWSDSVGTYQFTDNVAASGAQAQNTYEFWMGEGAQVLAVSPPAYQAQIASPALFVIGRNANTETQPVRLQIVPNAGMNLTATGKFFEW